MAGVCSWCGTSLEKSSEKIEFLCPACEEKINVGECDDTYPRRDWHSWMPEGPYPKLDRGDTRKV